MDAIKGSAPEAPKTKSSFPCGYLDDHLESNFSSFKTGIHANVPLMRDQKEEHLKEPPTHEIVPFRSEEEQTGIHMVSHHSIQQLSSEDISPKQTAMAVHDRSTTKVVDHKTKFEPGQTILGSLIESRQLKNNRSSSHFES